MRVNWLTVCPFLIVALLLLVAPFIDDAEAMSFQHYSLSVSPDENFSNERLVSMVTVKASRLTGEGVSWVGEPLHLSMDGDTCLLVPGSALREIAAVGFEDDSGEAARILLRSVEDPETGQRLFGSPLEEGTGSALLGPQEVLSAVLDAWRACSMSPVHELLANRNDRSVEKTN